MEPGDWLLVFHRLAGPKDTRTGNAYVQIANFRRVAFSVEITLPDRRELMGDSLQATLAGTYLAGGRVAKGKWSWFWTRRETWYQPPGDALADYTFGDVEKGWAEDLSSDSGSISDTGVTLSDQKLADGEKGRVYTYEFAGTVEDVDRQAISKSESRLVFSSLQLIGAKITSDARSDDSLYFVKKGQPFTLKTVSVDPDGKPYGSGPLSGRLIREEWKLVREASVGGMVDTRYEKEEVEEKSFTVKASGTVVATQLSTEKPGSYAIELCGKGRPGQGELHPHELLFDGHGGDPLAALRRAAPGDRARQEGLRAGGHRPTAHQEPARPGQLPGHRRAGRDTGAEDGGPGRRGAHRRHRRQGGACPHRLRLCFDIPSAYKAPGRQPRHA